MTIAGTNPPWSIFIACKRVRKTLLPRTISLITCFTVNDHTKRWFFADSLNGVFEKNNHDSPPDGRKAPKTESLGDSMRLVGRHPEQRCWTQSQPLLQKFPQKWRICYIIEKILRIFEVHGGRVTFDILSYFVGMLIVFQIKHVS